MKSKKQLLWWYYFYCFIVGVLAFPLYVTLGGLPAQGVAGMASILIVLTIAVCFGPVFRFREFRQVIGEDVVMIFQLAMIVLNLGFFVTVIFFQMMLGIVARSWPSAPRWFGPILLALILPIVIFLDVKLKNAFKRYAEEELC